MKTDLLLTLSRRSVEYSVGIERQYHDKATDATYVFLHGQVILGHDIDHLYVTNLTFLFRHSWQSTFHEGSSHTLKLNFFINAFKQY